MPAKNHQSIPGSSDQIKIFISYSRRDAAVADTLVQLLRERNFDVKIDTRDLPFGEKWQGELAEFIRLSDTVIWLISHASIQSQWVNWELDEVARLGKRLVPVMVGDADRATLPRQLGEIQILPRTGAFDPGRDLDLLVTVLETNHVWLKEATRLGDRAFEWLARNRDAGLLLRGSALTNAESWKDGRPPKASSLAPDVLDLILVSRQTATRRQRWWVGGSLAAMTVTIALAAFALLKQQAALDSAESALEATRAAEQARLNEQVERQRAVAAQAAENEQRERAATAAKRADTERTQGQAKESLALVQAARAAYNAKNYLEAMGLAAEALPSAGNPRPYIAEAERLLFDSLIRHQNSWKHYEPLIEERSTQPIPAPPPNLAASGAMFSTDGLVLVALSHQPTALATHLRMEDPVGELRPDLRVQQDNHSRSATIRAGAIATNGKILATGYSDYIDIMIYGVRTGPLFEPARKISVAEGNVTRLALSRDGSLVAAATQDRVMATWDTRSGNKIATVVGGHSDDINGILFDRNSRILTISKDKTAKLWEGKSGKELLTFAGHREQLTDANFNHDETELVTASRDGSAKIWDTKSAALLITINEGKGSGLTLASFNHDGTEVITLGRDGEVRIWSRKDGTQIATLSKGEFEFVSARYSRDGQRIFTGSINNASVWDRRTLRQIIRIPFPGRWSLGPVFSPLENAVIVPGRNDLPVIVPLYNSFLAELSGLRGRFAV